MSRYNKTNFAALAGVSPSAIHHRVKKGLLLADDEGYIDAEDVTNAEYLSSKDKLFPATPAPDPRPGPTAYMPPPPANPNEIPGTDLTNVDCSDATALMRLKRGDLAALKDIQAIRQKELKIRRDRGELIDRDLLVKFVGKLYSIDVNEFRTMAAVLAPEAAAVCGISEEAAILAVERIIESAVFDRLKSVKSSVDSFLGGF